MGEPRWLDDRETRAWRGLQEMQMRLGAEINRRLTADSGLSAQDYGVLVALTDEPEGALRLYQLADRLGWEKSRLSHHLSRMQQRGLVSKERCEQDRRGSFVRVTAKGRSEIAGAAPAHLDDVRQLVVDRLSTDQLEALAGISRAVLDGLDELECPGGPVQPDGRAE